MASPPALMAIAPRPVPEKFPAPFPFSSRGPAMACPRAARGHRIRSFMPGGCRGAFPGHGNPDL